MNLRKIAETDLGRILESESGFRWPIQLTSPDGISKELMGLTNDIFHVIDPDTGMMVSGRTASIALRIETIDQAFPGKGLPKAIANTSEKPWRVGFSDINGSPHKFTVSESNPDRTIGILACILESYE